MARSGAWQSGGPSFQNKGGRRAGFAAARLPPEAVPRGDLFVRARRDGLFAAGHGNALDKLFLENEV